MFDAIFATTFLALAVAAISRESQMVSLGYKLGASGYNIGTLAASGVWFMFNPCATMMPKKWQNQKALHFKTKGI